MASASKKGGVRKTHKPLIQVKSGSPLKEVSSVEDVPRPDIGDVIEELGRDDDHIRVEGLVSRPYTTQLNTLPHAILVGREKIKDLSIGEERDIKGKSPQTAGGEARIETIKPQDTLDANNIYMRLDSLTLEIKEIQQRLIRTENKSYDIINQNRDTLKVLTNLSSLDDKVNDLNKIITGGSLLSKLTENVNNITVRVVELEEKILNEAKEETSEATELISGKLLELSTRLDELEDKLTANELIHSIKAEFGKGINLPDIIREELSSTRNLYSHNKLILETTPLDSIEIITGSLFETPEI